MKERPIPFRTEMVRGLLRLDGLEKTQTRRVCKPQPYSVGDQFSTRQHNALMIRYHGEDAWSEHLCPFGVPGDRLWVRERVERYFLPNILTGDPTKAKVIKYAADDAPVLTEDGFDYCWTWMRDFLPPMFMPRFMARIFLEITEVRVQRLQEISAEDAVAEGLMPYAIYGGKVASWKGHSALDAAHADPRDAFRDLWGNAKFPWASDPWVWAITFKVLP